MNERKLFTLGDVSRLLNAPQHVVEYAIRTYEIEPAQRAGIIRLWGQDGVERIARAMQRIQHRRLHLR